MAIGPAEFAHDATFWLVAALCAFCGFVGYSIGRALERDKVNRQWPEHSERQHQARWPKQRINTDG